MSTTRLEARLEKVRRLRTYALQERNSMKAIQANHIIFLIQSRIAELTKPTRP
jgi:hypothetical protein